MKSSGAVLFLLGAGASVDSGLRTYRGGNSKYYNFDEEDPKANPLHVSALCSKERMVKMWEHLEPIVKDIPNEPGPTYQRIKEIAANHDHCMIATQNIDGLALKLGLRDSVVELHGTLSVMQCQACHARVVFKMGDYTCPECDGMRFPDIVLFGEAIPEWRLDKVNRFIKKRKPSAVYVIGSSMRFPYLFSILRNAKTRAGSQIIHVNPDPEYIWHTHKERHDLSSMTGEVVVKRIKKKKPEVLIKEL